MTCYVCQDPDKPTRPFGEDGKPICQTCISSTPERLAEAQLRFGVRVSMAAAKSQKDHAKALRKAKRKSADKSKRANR